jgi:mannan endo-1,4-beta-mannosidase
MALWCAKSTPAHQQQLETDMKHHPTLFALTCAAALLAVPLTASAGFAIKSAKLVDNNGNAFVMRGVNYPYLWFTSRDTQQDLKNIAATKANTVRIVLGSGARWSKTTGSEITKLINWCKQNKMIAVLEVHDSTGWGEESSASHISNSASYWVSSDVKSALQGQESYVIINIANEPFGNNKDSSYVTDTSNAIKTLRSGGLKHTLMVDGANWGQDNSGTLKSNAKAIFNADTLKNTIFSVHMYAVYGSASTITSYMDAFKSAGMPLVVGEFGAAFQGQNVDEATIMSQAQSRGLGYLGWSWSGNSGNDAPLDIVSNFSTTLTAWGKTLIDGSNGIKATAKVASVFSSTSSTCNWSGTSYPVCKSDDIGWGYENSASCISSNLCATQTGGQCNWGGTLYPTCATDNGDWGWENSKSCISVSKCATQN